MKKSNWRVLPVILTVLCLSACSSKSSPLQETTAYDYMDATINEESDIPLNQPIGNSLSSPESKEVENNNTLAKGRKLIRNVSMNIETDTFEKLVSNMQTDIVKLGGYVENSDISGNSLNAYGEPDKRHANIIARVPVNQLDNFINEIQSSGNVTYKSESTQDVTLQYNDLESKKKSLLIEQKKMWEFLEKADSAETVITLEKRLSEIRYQLESMESQLRLYDNQVDYSTVTLYINEVKTFTPTTPQSVGTRIQKGLTGNFRLFKTALVNFFIGIITTFPFWFPIVLIVGFIVHFSRKRKAKVTPPLPPSKEEK